MFPRITVDSLDGWGDRVCRGTVLQNVGLGVMKLIHLTEEKKPLASMRIPYWYAPHPLHHTHTVKRAGISRAISDVLNRTTVCACV